MSATPTNPASNPAVTAAAHAAADTLAGDAAGAVDATPELDVVSLLVRDADGNPPKDEAQGAKDGADGSAAAEKAGDEVAEGGAGEDGQEDVHASEGTTPQPGTPDKALQKLQQDFAATNRKLDALLAKADAPAGLSAQEKQQAQAAKRKLDAIREGLAAKGADFDLLAHDQDVAGALLEHDDALTATQTELKATQQRLAALEQHHAQAGEAQLWAAAQAKYPGVQVRPVWDKAVADAYAQIGVPDAAKLPPDSPLHQAAENVANHLFDARADAAARAVKAKGGAGAAGGKPAAAAAPRTAAAPTPGGGRVTGQPGGVAASHATGAEPSEDTQYLADAMALVKT